MLLDHVPRREHLWRKTQTLCGPERPASVPYGSTAYEVGATVQSWYRRVVYLRQQPVRSSQRLHMQLGFARMLHVTTPTAAGYPSPPAERAVACSTRTPLCKGHAERLDAEAKGAGFFKQYVQHSRSLTCVCYSPLFGFSSIASEPCSQGHKQGLCEQGLGQQQGQEP